MVVLVIGCDLFAATPSFAVAVPDHQEFTINVFDRSGLVTAARAPVRSTRQSLDAEATADPANHELTLRWFGGVCHFGPAVTVSGTAAALHLLLEPDAGPGLPFFASCPAAGLEFGLTLTLAEPVEQDAVSVEVTTR